MFRSIRGGGELLLDCFTVDEVRGYSVHVYEIQCDGELGHRCEQLPDVVFKQQEMEEEKASITEFHCTPE